MAKIVGLEEIQTSGHLQSEIQQGAKFVMFQYCISLLIITFKRFSNIYFVRPGENPIMKGLPCSLLSLFLGWWGIPWGPIYTVQALWVNFSGGKDVTREILVSMSSISQHSS
jgi:hypothetical protein